MMPGALGLQNHVTASLIHHHITMVLAEQLNWLRSTQVSRQFHAPKPFCWSGDFSRLKVGGRFLVLKG